MFMNSKKVYPNSDSEKSPVWTDSNSFDSGSTRPDGTLDPTATSMILPENKTQNKPLKNGN